MYKRLTTYRKTLIICFGLFLVFHVSLYIIQSSTDWVDDLVEFFAIGGCIIALIIWALIAFRDKFDPLAKKTSLTTKIIPPIIIVTGFIGGYWRYAEALAETLQKIRDGSITFFFCGEIAIVLVISVSAFFKK